MEKRSWVAVAPIVVAVSLGGPGGATAERLPVVTIDPAVVTLGDTSTVTVSGAEPQLMEVHLAGATSSRGKPLGWTPLVWFGRTFQGLLPHPAIRGIYPLEIRTGSHAPALRSPNWMLRVLAPGTLRRPSFGTPRAVISWWVRAMLSRPSHLVAIRSWPLPHGDLRDPRLHKLFVIAYSPIGDSRIKDRLGIWITAFRDGYTGPWRLLEATVAPPA
jgi:hypothetical protein